ncbi:lipopolysaccharide biosynthesis protein [Gordonia amicalis]|uniref:MATE family efflux transporter n=1 Tax=Gordonia amicalis TaxID=89053 RepID=A0ABU4DLS5_9ACTN|nr:MATE family efflux transporter [Gordonia amicalis]MDV6309976.1 MATE family efflux transporter [Gordonia amicalis]
MTTSESVREADSPNARTWISTFVAYGFSQGIVAVGAFVRIPLIVNAIGSSGYGRLVAVTVAWQCIAMLLEGISQASRAVSAERGLNREQTQRLFRRISLLEAGLVLVTVAMPALLVVFCVSDSEVANGTAMSVFAVALVASSTLPFAASKGYLESRYRTGWANLAMSSTTIVGVPILVLGLSVSQTLPTAALCTALGNAAPYVVCWLLARRVEDPASLGKQHESTSFGEVRQITVSMTIFGAGSLLAYGLDPLAVAVLQGAEAAAEYGLASRIFMVAMFLPMGLGGLVTARVARSRAAGTMEATRLWVTRTSLLLTCVGAVLAIVGVIAAGPISSLLSHDEIHPQLSLFVALAVYSLLTTASLPLVCAFTSQVGARIRSRVALGAGALNVLLTFVLCAVTGTAGAVWASVIANSGMILALLFVAVKLPRLVFGRTDLESLVDGE